MCVYIDEKGSGKGIRVYGCTCMQWKGSAAFEAVAKKLPRLRSIYVVCQQRLRNVAGGKEIAW